MQDKRGNQGEAELEAAIARIEAMFAAAVPHLATKKQVAALPDAHPPVERAFVEPSHLAERGRGRR